MAKRLFLLLILSFIGVVLNPGFLSADQIIKIKQPQFRAVETIIKPSKPEYLPKITPAIVTAPQKATNVKPVPVYIPPANSISFNGRTIEIIDTSVISDSGNFVNHYTGLGGRFYYGHNSPAVFGTLNALGDGSTFVIRTNGIDTTYRVMKKVIYQKAWQTAGGEITYNGDGVNHINSVAKACYDSPGKLDCAIQYHISLMTCHGQPLGGGDATERLVIFANRI